MIIIQSSLLVLHLALIIIKCKLLYDDHRDTRSGAVIVRCSQPEVGWLGWRSPQDESLLQAISAACKLNPGTAVQNPNSDTSGIDNLK